MLRFGKFTGTIYDKDFDTSKIEECCLFISEEHAKDKEFLLLKRAANIITCCSCQGCPAFQKEIFE